MAFLEETAPWRARKTRAKIVEVVRCIMKTVKRLPSGRAMRQPHLSDHLARDIGLSPGEIELQRFELPSRTTYHPRG